MHVLSYNYSKLKLLLYYNNIVLNDLTHRIANVFKIDSKSFTKIDIISSKKYRNPKGTVSYSINTVK